VRRLVPFVLAAAIALLAGCGSSSSGTSSSPTDSGASADAPPTRAEFIAKADAICAAARAKQASLRTKIGELAKTARGEEQSKVGGISDATRRELAEALRQVADIAGSDLPKISAIGPPEADASKLATIFGKLESVLETTRTYAAALETHEDAKAQAVAEQGNAETSESARLAKQYGFEVCGSAPSQE
jgi:hypothetical protein